MGIQLALGIISFIFIMTCPGNTVRTVAEEGNWFPGYSMLGLIDKLDVGLSRMLVWIFSGSPKFILFGSIGLLIIIWNKYESFFYRMLALIPVIISFTFGPLKDIINSVFPYLGKAFEELNNYGSFNVAEGGEGVGMLRFAILLFTFICIIIEIILINDKLSGFLTELTLLAAGTASDVVMGFSPTIYASGTRTHCTISLCFMLAMFHAITNNDLPKRTKEILIAILYSLVILNVGDFIYMIGTIGH